jgi:hypothetical protein
VSAKQRDAAHPQEKLASAIALHQFTNYKTMPRKKKDPSEPASVLQPDLNVEQTLEPIEPDQQQPESCNRSHLLAFLLSVQSSTSLLLEKQSEIAGTQSADAVFDAFEIAFTNQLEARLQPFMDVVLPQIKDGQTQLADRATERKGRQLRGFDRLRQIAATITDECKLLPPVVAVGEFLTWEPIIEDKENA